MSEEHGPKSEVQGWEYKFLTRGRGIKGTWGAALQALGGEGAPYIDATGWNPKDLAEQVQALGKEGWRLRFVVPRSSIAGVQGAGFTSDELWIFERPL